MWTSLHFLSSKIDCVHRTSVLSQRLVAASVQTMRLVAAMCHSSVLQRCVAAICRIVCLGLKPKAKWERLSLRCNLTCMLSEDIASYADKLVLRRLIKTDHNMKYDYSEVRSILYCPLNFNFRDFFAILQTEMTMWSFPAFGSFTDIQASRKMRYIQTIATIWRVIMLGYLSADIICSE